MDSRKKGEIEGEEDPRRAERLGTPVGEWHFVIKTSISSLDEETRA